MIEMRRIGASGADGVRPESGMPLWDRLAWALFVVAAALVIVTFTDYGVTWDEDVHSWYGFFVLGYYLSFFHDLRAFHWGDLYNYGAAFDLTAAVIDRISPFGIYETRHLLNGSVGVVGIIGAWKLGRALRGPRAGFIAALFLLLTPNYYGQMFNNPKDVPFAVGMVWAMYYLVRIMAELPRPRGRLVVKFGMATGLALGVRVGGLLLFGYLGLALLLFALWRGLETRRPGAFAAAGWTSFRRVLLPAVMMAYPVMLLFWPWAQQAPFSHPLQTLAYFSHEIFPFRTLFAGRYFPATDLPWAYLPTYIVLALPELILVLLVASPFVALAIAWQRGLALERTPALQLLILGFAIVFPVAYAVAIKAVLFDGMRHFIFVLPLIAALTAALADRLLDGLAGDFRLQTSGVDRRNDPPCRAAAAGGAPPLCRDARRRRRHFRLARQAGTGGAGGDGQASRHGADAGAVAHDRRPSRREHLPLRPPRRDLQQDRARDLHLDEDRVRRGRGTGAARHGRQLDDAAEAQPQALPGHHRRRGRGSRQRAAWPWKRCRPSTRPTARRA